jgi:hypothetical protein
MAPIEFAAGKGRQCQQNAPKRISAMSMYGFLSTALTSRTIRKLGLPDQLPSKRVTGKVLPAQTVDARLSNALTRRSFADRTDLFDCTRSNPAQDSVPADLTLAAILSFVFNASRVRPKCCVDPLNPPPINGNFKRKALPFGSMPLSLSALPLTGRNTRSLRISNAIRTS